MTRGALRRATCITRVQRILVPPNAKRAGSETMIRDKKMMNHGSSIPSLKSVAFAHDIALEERLFFGNSEYYLIKNAGILSCSQQFQIPGRDELYSILA